MVTVMQKFQITIYKQMERVKTRSVACGTWNYLVKMSYLREKTIGNTSTYIFIDFEVDDESSQGKVKRYPTDSTPQAMISNKSIFAHICCD